ncbi:MULTISPECIES: hypothetical protein [Modicisalibacter]|uniref:Uncharacterized protein n=1 Tax=Modicisalibacter tunisiensis TaxID=390637 RepID=A0ABS7WV40_9GAMM|nr:MULTISPECIES: hypothetical protein [Modicisalibacter]MBZ9566480.1 hypothetical protein [Modicisalibacter tunisiensis]
MRPETTGDDRALHNSSAQRLLAGERDADAMRAVPRWPLAELTPPRGER